MVSAIEWTGKNPAVINSLELIKEDGKPVLFEDDGISYKFYGADSQKSEGTYTFDNIGDLKDIEGLKVKGKGKIVIGMTLGKVTKDSNRKLKVNYTINGKVREQIILSHTYKELSTRK
ncbi:hypothetical protein AMD00_00670 [Viridibacillus arvi]|uniref:Uncharacterized protein n=2 Tax=Viridibacillus arvi TaxID=263475 RepID=A0A0M0LJA3_9BACL|nr:hypothetical protein AMD00_00670 [Viridibacillus arvi]